MSILLLIIVFPAKLACSAETEAEIPDPSRQVNLLINPGFELAGSEDEIAQGWLPMGEDQRPDWERATYANATMVEEVRPHRNEGSAYTGLRGLQLVGQSKTVSAVWQRVVLLQKEPRPVIMACWHRCDKSKAWAEFGLANVRYMDGTKDDVDRRKPLVDLSKGDGEWTLSQAVFTPQKPIRYIEVKVDLHGCQSLTSLSVDNLLVAEVDSTAAELYARGLDIPAAQLVCAPQWATFERDASEVTLITRKGAGLPLSERLPILVTADDEALTIETERALAEDEALEFLLAPYARKPLNPHYAADFYRVGISMAGEAKLSWGMTRNERHLGVPNDASYFVDRQALPPITVSRRPSDKDDHWKLRIPFEAIEQSPPSAAVWRVSVCLRQGDELACSAPTYARERLFGRLVFPEATAEASQLVVERATVEEGDSWKERNIDLLLSWRGNAKLKAKVTAQAPLEASARQSVKLAPGQQHIRLTLPLHQQGLQVIDIAVVEQKTSRQLAALSLSADVKNPVFAWMYETFLYEDEDEAEVRVRIDEPTLRKTESVRAQVEDWRGQSVGKPVEEKLGLLQETDEERKKAQRLRPHAEFLIPVADIPVNEEPICDHTMVVQALDRRGDVLAETRLPFGRMQKPEPRTLEPIKTSRINDRGYLEVNGKPFFAVIVSLKVKDDYNGYLRTPRCGFNAAKVRCGNDDLVAPVGDRKDISIRGLYTELYKQGTYAAPNPWTAGEEQLKNLFTMMKESPFFLLTVAGEAYREDGTKYSSPLWTEYPERPMLIEHHNAGTWLSIENLGKTVADVAMYWFGFRPHSPYRWGAASFARERAIKPDMGLIASTGVGLSPEFTQWDTRNSCYRAAIEGATGVYVYICTSDDQDDRIIEQTRGLATELRLMSPVFLAENQERTMLVEPLAQSGLFVAERLVDGERYLLVSNTNAQPIKAEFTLSEKEEADSVRVRFERHYIKLQSNRSFEDEIPARWARVYRICLR